MTDPRYLPAIKELNQLPISQQSLRHLERLKAPIDHQQLYPVQLIIWAQERGRLELEPELADYLPGLPDQDPEDVAELLQLESHNLPTASPTSTAQALAEELRDRMKGIEPEDEEA
jgi:DNA polymerase III psi subunit